MVTTLAGNGRAGIIDGSASTSEFVMPVGLQYDGAGNLFVADSAGQRIREITKHGQVVTVAGGGNISSDLLMVQPGFRNGPDSQARFSSPTSVVVAPNGDLFVADSLNYCVRRISQGSVTTYAGMCGKNGDQNGLREVATFTRPLSLALSRNGDLYVADFGVGIRKITATGTVTTLPFENGQDALAVALWQDRLTDRLFVGRLGWMMVYETGTLRQLFGIPYHVDFGFEGFRESGQASGFAPIGPREVIYGDARTHSVRYLQFNAPTVGNSRALSELPDEEAPWNNGGFRDGPGNLALFDEPVGVAVSPDRQHYAVADAGNKRVRALSQFDRTSWATFTPSLGPRRSHDYRIALVGTSLIWTASTLRESLAGRIQARLAGQLRVAGSPVEVQVIPFRNIGLKLESAETLVDQELSNGAFDLVILCLDSNYFTGIESPRMADVTNIGGNLSAALKAMKNNLATNKTQFVVVLQPVNWEVSPFESGYFRSLRNWASLDISNVSFVQTYVRQARSAVREAGVFDVDMWKAVYDENLSPQHRPLFISQDHHLTPWGNEFEARIISRRVLELINSHSKM